jgi:hypothetical protein
VVVVGDHGGMVIQALRLGTGGLQIRMEEIEIATGIEIETETGDDTGTTLATITDMIATAAETSATLAAAVTTMIAKRETGKVASVPDHALHHRPLAHRRLIIMEQTGTMIEIITLAPLRDMALGVQTLHQPQQQQKRTPRQQLQLPLPKRKSKGRRRSV